MLNFIIKNNLSFNILNLHTFKELLSYYNRLALIINRSKIKLILKNSYNNKFITLINNL